MKRPCSHTQRCMFVVNSGWIGSKRFIFVSQKIDFHWWCDFPSYTCYLFHNINICRRYLDIINHYCSYTTRTYVWTIDLHRRQWILLLLLLLFFISNKYPKIHVASLIIQSINIFFFNYYCFCYERCSFIFFRSNTIN